MKIFALMLTLALCLLAAPTGMVYSQNQVEYYIYVNASGTTEWTIRQTLPQSASYDDLNAFQFKIESLLRNVVSSTSRNMTGIVNSMTSSAMGSYILVEYNFYWTDFGEKENSKVVIGDVFQASGFFNQLYGDGETFISYPAQYIVETVAPPPSKRDDSNQLLEWLGTADFDSNVNIVLGHTEPGFNLIEVLEENLMLIVGIVVVVSGLTGTLYVLRRRNRKTRKSEEISSTKNLLMLETEEEKVIRLLESNGGSMFQSAITDNLRFSRAKTSLLLSTLERKGIIKRFKRGRDKIVTLAKKGERDQQ
ncbi:MAG TPA: hypothetical protein VMW36_01375 [Patescibacteria group bacterium]|nr:hypothetical protein [Patescibacteria group bacterium]